MNLCISKAGFSDLQYALHLYHNTVIQKVLFVYVYSIIGWTHICHDSWKKHQKSCEAVLLSSPDSFYIFGLLYSMYIVYCILAANITFWKIG